LKISITLGGNSFNAEGEFAFDDGLATVFRAWINAQQDGSAAETVDALTERMKKANAAQEAAVAENTPQQP